MTDGLSDHRIKVCFLMYFNTADAGIIVNFDPQL